MSQFVRVFLKGEPVRWFDYPLPTGHNFKAFVMQVRFEGFVLGDFGYIVNDEIRGMMLCAGAPESPLKTMQPQGQA